jgi:hypothetical protein
VALLSLEVVVCQIAGRRSDECFDKMPDFAAGAMIVLELLQPPFVAICELTSRLRPSALQEVTATLLKECL